MLGTEQIQKYFSPEIVAGAGFDSRLMKIQQAIAQFNGFAGYIDTTFLDGENKTAAMSRLQDTFLLICRQAHDENEVQEESQVPKTTGAPLVAEQVQE